MKNIDRIRKYINGQKEQGVLKPGDKLPSFNALMDMFNVSYLTVSSAINKLAKEGLLETRKGSGSYLAGANKLKVLINIHPTTISFSNLKKILNKHLANAELYLDFEIQEVQKLADPVEMKRISREYKAAVSVHPVLINEQELPPSLLTEFPDYKKVMSQLQAVDGVNYEYCLPFTFYSHQIGVNRKLLAETGYTLSDLTADFGWWKDFVKKCREKNLIPCSVDYMEMSPILIQDFLPLMLSWTPYDENKYEGNGILFDTPEGKHLLDVIRDTVLITETMTDKRSFYLNGAVLCPRVGSWLTVQNLAPERPDKVVEDLDFIPYRTPDGRKLNIMAPDSLKAYMRHDITPDERGRIWELLKIMVSREFQMDFCGISGQVSANKNILPTEHFWNRENNRAGFFPDQDSTVMHLKNVFSLSRIAMLSTLVENFKLYHHDIGETLKRMDIKKKHYQVKVPKNTIK